MKLLIGGSPCTHWSIAQTKDRETEPKGIGWELFKNYLIALDKFRPAYFLYENNKSMSQAIREQITRELGVEPICINSALVSAQNRQRLYWTNIPGVQQPEDRGILLRDILESGLCWKEKARTLRASTGAHSGLSNVLRDIETGGQFGYMGAAEPVYIGSGKPLTDKEMDYMLRETKDGRNHFDFEYFHDAGKDKSACITANTHKGVPYNVLAEPIRVGDMPNAAGKISGSQSGRIYSVDGKGVPLQARPRGGGADGAATGLYAIPMEDPKESGETAMAPIEYNPLHDCDVVISENNIRCAYSDGSGTAQGYTVYFEDVKAPSVIAGHANKMKVIQRATGKEYPVYEVSGGQITIKGKQYPIKLADGFYIIRKLTVTECKRLQTVPENFVFPVSDTQAYKMLGNGWTVDVIAHILHYAPGITTAPLEVLSMYDGMSCGRLALNKLGATISKYWATEIDKYAIQTTQHNFPETVQLGDAFQVRNEDWGLPGQIMLEEFTERGHMRGGNHPTGGRPGAAARAAV